MATNADLAVVLESIARMDPSMIRGVNAAILFDLTG